MYGGVGNNTLDGGSGFDLFAASSVLLCGEDRFPGSIIDTHGMDIDLGAGTASGDFEVSTLTSFEGAFGTTNEDTLAGDDHANRLIGGTGKDEIKGRGGDDLLDGGRQIDRLDGGDGSDTCRNGEVVFACEESR